MIMGQALSGRVYLFGSFELWLGGRKTDPRLWSSRSGRKLLAYLLLRHPEPVPREELAETLFPSPSDSSSSERCFYFALAGLRRCFERLGVGPGVLCREGTYLIDEQLSLGVDARDFLSALREAETSEEEGLARLEEALTLYRGEFLAGIRSCPWVQGERERFRSLYLRACRRKGDLLLALGRREEAKEAYLAGFLRYPERGDLLLPLADITLIGVEEGILRRALSLHFQRLRRLRLQPLPKVAALSRHLGLPGF